MEYEGEPLHDWLEGLANAAKEYRAAEGDHGLQLESMLHAVGAILDAVGSVPEARPYGDPLHHLFLSLSRLAAGHHDDVLKPLREEKQAGRPRSDGATIFKQATALYVAELIYRGRGGKRGVRRTADDDAAELLATEGMRGPDGDKISANMIRGWRSRAALRGDMEEVGKLLSIMTAHLSDQLALEDAIADATEIAKRAMSYPGIKVSRYSHLT